MATNPIPIPPDLDEVIVDGFISKSWLTFLTALRKAGNRTVSIVDDNGDNVFTVDSEGNVIFANNIEAVDGTFSGHISGITLTITDSGIIGSLTVEDNAAVGGDLAVTGDISGSDITGDLLDVTGEVGGGSLDIAGNGDIDGTLDVGNDLDVTTDLRVGGVATAVETVIAGTAYSQDGIRYPLQARRDHNNITYVTIENQTAGASAKAGIAIRTNSAVAFIWVADDGHTGIPETADDLTLYIGSDVEAINLMAAGGSSTIKLYSGGDTASELVAVFSPTAITFNRPVTVNGTQGADGIININADAGDDDADKWRIVANEGAAGFTLETFATGSWVAVLTVDANNDVTLANDLDVTTDLRAGNDITAAAGDVKATAGDLIAPTDNKGLIVGGGSDAAVYYDGAAMTLKTDRIAASDLDIITGSQKTIELQTVVYDDMRVPLQNTKINPTKSEPAFENFADGLFAYAFENNNADDESLHFVAQLPHSYKEGTDIVPHVHWMPSTTNAGSVVWELEYIWVNVNGTTPGSVSITVTDAGDGTALKQQKAIFAAIDGTGKTISSVLTGRLTRLTSDPGDDFTGIAYGLEIDFHHQIDTIGSRQPLVK